VVFELIELRETDTARAMLRQTQVFARMKLDDAERYLRLEHLCNRAYFDARELYGSTPRDKRRAQLAHSLSGEVSTVPPSRLMALVGQALKW
jgi:WD40 repeat-containing protein SMU1